MSGKLEGITSLKEFEKLVDKLQPKIGYSCGRVFCEKEGKENYKLGEIVSKFEELVKDQGPIEKPSTIWKWNENHKTIANINYRILGLASLANLVLNDKSNILIRIATCRQSFFGGSVAEKAKRQKFLLEVKEEVNPFNLTKDKFKAFVKSFKYPHAFEGIDEVSTTANKRSLEEALFMELKITDMTDELKNDIRITVREAYDTYVEKR